MIRILVILFALLCGCAGTNRTIGSTRIPDSSNNREVIKTIESYRVAVEKKDIQKLLLMTASSYTEDRGSIRPKDHYGRAQLPAELRDFFSKAEDIRYSLRYEKIKWDCPEGKDGDYCRAMVEVKIDASFTLENALGQPSRIDKQDQNRLILIWVDEQWKFEEGM